MAKSNSAVSMEAEDRKWKARCDMRTLSEAEEIRGDKARHSAAQAVAKEEMEKIAAVAGEQKMRSAGRESMDKFVSKREGKK